MHKQEELFIAAEAWFKRKNWVPAEFQKKAWMDFLEGRNGLLNAPTGSGKTYALLVPIVLEQLKRQGDRAKKGGLKALWITPLRALSVEIQKAAETFIAGIDADLSVGIRTGDTPQKLRAAQKKQMPDILITTPESLHLLLSQKDYERKFSRLFAVVVDEWHELLGTKRGVQIELGLSRLKKICEPRIWGISATIGNLEQAREVLLGLNSSSYSNSTLIKAEIKKEIKVSSIFPSEFESFPWRGHLGLHLLNEVVEIIKSSRSSLLFTNTRSQCEIWFQKILEKYPEFAGELAVHHGSINKETRLWVEQALRDGSIKAVIATSSLDLGVDFSPVETIIQIGGPKGVARFIQRAGRSGHQPGKRSTIYFLPTHAMELIEASALQEAVKANAVEDRIPYLMSFDVLVQYLVTLAIGSGFKPEEIFPEVAATFCYQSITKNQWQWILNFITQGSQSLDSYDEYKKVEVEEDGIFRVHNKAVAMRHRFQIGTIVGDAVLAVKYLHGGYLGTIEESFISRLSPGEVFTFAGKNLELYSIKNMQVLVKKSKIKNARFPSWAGGRMTFSAQMSELLRLEIHKAASGNYDTRELKALEKIFDRQKQESIVPGKKEFLIESFKTREGFHIIFYPFEGRFVHEAMASLLSYRIGLLSPISFSLSFNDYGFELLSDQQIDIQEIIDNNLFSTSGVMSDLYKSLNSTEMASRKFRDIAVISGLIFSGYPHKMIKTKHLQSNSQLLFKVFRDYEPENLLFQQAFRETFEHQLEEARLLQALERIEGQNIVAKSCSKPTPFSFPLITDRLRDKFSNEKLEDRIRKMIEQWTTL